TGRVPSSTAARSYSNVRDEFPRPISRRRRSNLITSLALSEVALVSARLCMKTVGKTLLVVLLSIAALGLACSDQSSPGKGEAKNAEVKKVPLDSIYSTNGQQGLKPVDR